MKKLRSELWAFGRGRKVKTADRTNLSKIYVFNSQGGSSRRFGRQFAVLTVLAGGLALAGCNSPVTSPGGSSDGSFFTVKFDTSKKTDEKVLKGEPQPNAQTIYLDNLRPVTQPAPPPSLAGYKFIGWFKVQADAEADAPDKNNAYDFSAAVTANMTLYAGWKKVDGAFEINSVSDWDAALAAIHEAGNGKSEADSKDYELTMKANIKIVPGATNTVDTQFVNVTLIGDSDTRTLEPAGTVGQLLIIGEKQKIEVKSLTLVGKTTNQQALVSVENGAFELGDKAKITGNTNQASHGGAIWAKNAVITVSGGAISNNIVSANNTQGAAIYSEASAITLNKALISANSTPANGNIVVSGGSITINDSDIKDNLRVATVWAGNGANVTVDNSRFSGNASSSLYITGGTLAQTISVKTSVFSKNGNQSIYGNSNITGTIEDCEFTENGGYNLELRGAGSVYTVTNARISDATTNYSVYINTAKAELKGCVITRGYTYPLFITESAEVTVEDCAFTGSRNWGAIIEQGAVVTLKGNTRFENNSSGGLQVRDSKMAALNASITKQTTCTIEEGVIIKDNKANNGPGVQVEKWSKFVMNGGTISGHTRSGNGGGILLSTGAAGIMTGGLITGNTASSSGGGVYINYSDQTVNGASGTPCYATFTMSGGIIDGNTASGGGGVYVYGKSNAPAGFGGMTHSLFVMSGDAKIQNNTAGSAGNDGGGLYVNNGKAVLLEGSITGNTASRYGGGICMINGAVVTLAGPDTAGTGPKISGNYAKNYNGNATNGGGGVYVGAGTLQLANGTIHGNDTANEALKNKGGANGAENVNAALRVPNATSVKLGIYTPITGPDDGNGTFVQNGTSVIAASTNNTLFIRNGAIDSYDEDTEDPATLTEVTLAVTPNEENGTTTSLTLAFSPNIPGLVAGDIELTSADGATFTKGSLAGNGADTPYALGVTVTAEGSITVTVTKAGYDIEEKTVQVVMPTP